MMNFDEIRPFRSEEIQPVIQRLLANPEVHPILAYIFPDQSLDEVIKRLELITDVDELQKEVSFLAVKQIISDSTDGLTVSGLSHLKPHLGHLFISNHRDIIMDSAFLSYSLVAEGQLTVEVGTGDNLFFSPLVSDLMRLNKSFKIHRNLSPRQLHSYSVRLSHYIRHRVKEDQTSLWIAQRNGRTKDGNDKTETGLLKMLGLAGDDFFETFQSLHIIPMAISYEFDPCDRFKAQENFLKASGQAFEKNRMVDYMNMVAGIRDHKGRVHISLGSIEDFEIAEIAKIVNKNERFRSFTQLIDRKIQGLFKLFSNNYIAADMLHNRSIYRQYYTLSEKKAFENHLSEMAKKLKHDKKELLPFLLNIYAQPVANQIAAGSLTKR